MEIQTRSIDAHGGGHVKGSLFRDGNGDLRFSVALGESERPVTSDMLSLGFAAWHSQADGDDLPMPVPLGIVENSGDGGERVLSMVSSSGDSGGDGGCLMAVMEPGERLGMGCLAGQGEEAGIPAGRAHVRMDELHGLFKDLLMAAVEEEPGLVDDAHEVEWRYFEWASQEAKKIAAA